MRPARVCMLVFNSLERDPRVWKEAHTLARHGATVAIYMQHRAGEPASTVTVADGVVVHRITSRSPTSRNPRVSVPAWRAFRAAVPRDADVYHCHDGATLAIGAPMAKRVPLVYDAHEYFPDHLPPAGVSGNRRWTHRLTVNRVVERLFIRRANAVITVNDSIARLLSNHHGLPAEPVVLRNAVPYWEPPPDARERLRRRFDLDPDAAVLLFHGNVAPSRGVESCIDVAARIDDAVLLIVGPGDPAYLDRLKAQVDEAGIGKRVRIAGFVPYGDLLEVAAGADVGLYLVPRSGLSTSYRYSLPNKLFEYAVARLPMVVTDLPEMRRFVETNGLGLCVDPARPDAVAATVGALLGDRQRWSEARWRLESVAPELAWESEEARLVTLYEGLLGA